MKYDRKNKILYGNPAPENFYYGAQSLGELFFNRLTEQNDFVVLVNMKNYVKYYKS